MTTKPKSCIKHPEKVPLVLLRSEYLEITGNHCAAKLLAIFEFWTNKLNAVGNALGKTARDWIYKSLACLQNELMGEHGIHAIRKGISVLEDLGFISKRHNPHIKYDRTWQYRLEVETVQEALNLLICQDEQMEDEILPILTGELEPSNAQISTDNNIEFNIVPPKLKTKKEPEVFEKTEENKTEEITVIKHIANFFDIGYQPAENTFRQWCADWNNRPSAREWLSEKLTSIGLDISVLT